MLSGFFPSGPKLVLVGGLPRIAASSPGIGLQGTPEGFEGGVVVAIAGADRMSVRSFMYDDTRLEGCDCETNEGAELSGPLSRGSKVR